MAGPGQASRGPAPGQLLPDLPDLVRRDAGPRVGDNENGLPVASGMYIAYLELKDVDGNDLGTKTLKLMIVQEQQYLDSY